LLTRGDLERTWRADLLLIVDLENMLQQACRAPIDCGGTL
jgi:hypothetical protein